MRSKSKIARLLAAAGAAFLLLAQPLHSEVILQYFNTSWNEVAARMPELAEAGYQALWLPPPFKAGNQFSVGFDSFDRFDYGTKDQMGGVPTRYGTGAELLNLMELAHRFGIRIYFDNVMAHNGGPIPGYDEWTSVTVQPGFVPEDFHLLMRADGTFRKAGEWPAWWDEWQVLNYNPFGIDIAQENPNTCFGANVNDDFPKYSGIRHPNNPEYYLDSDLSVGTTYDGYPVYTFANKEPFQDTGYGGGTGAGNGKFDWNDANANGQHDSGETSEPFTDTGLDPNNPLRQTTTWGYGDGKYNMGNIAAEDVNAMLIRAIRWFTDQAHVDGYRLDAVKHVPFYFFGKTYDTDKDRSNWGYCGGVQEQFNVSRGYSDWANHRDTVFNDQQARDDAMFFGEHISAPPDQGPYLDAGTRIADNDIMGNLTYACSAWGSLSGQDQPGNNTMGWNLEVLFVGSHDNNYMSLYDRPTAHSLIITRTGLPIIYTDGYNEEKTPDADGKFFPQNGDNAFVGQFGDRHLPNLLYIHECFARGPQVWSNGTPIEGQIPKWSDQHYVAYERRDKRENQVMTDEDGSTLIFMAARNGAPGGQARDFTTTFPADARLVNYSYHGGAFYAVVQANRTLRDTGGSMITVDPGKYFAFSWRSPEMPTVWDDGILAQVKPILVYQNGQPAGTMSHERRDGRDGDPAFNPYSLPDADTTNYAYTMTVPRVTAGTNLAFVARADGSAENILLKLDGGVDLNSQMGLGPLSGEKRDYPPAVSTDIFHGFEQMKFVDRIREKFAAVNVSRNCIGSPGSESYYKTIGSGNPTNNLGTSTINTSDGTVNWVYHDPNANHYYGSKQYQESSTNVEIWVKVGYKEDWYTRVLLYYTLDGGTNAYPEGSRGVGKGNTLARDFGWVANQPETGHTADWWRVTFVKPSGGTTLRYKIGVYKSNSSSVFPWSAFDISLRKPMETMFEITNFNAQTLLYYPHADYDTVSVGLKEGFHILRSKPFLKRDGSGVGNGKRAAIFNLFKQTFYYDTQRPAGAILYPQNNGDTIYSSTYGVVARADLTTEEAWYRITDSNTNNDDAATGTPNGNAAWVRAIEVTPTLSIVSAHPREFRFNYVNIPTGGTAAIEVRLREVTSSTNDALSDVDGHFTTLTRTVNTRGPEQTLFVAWPQRDGDVVGAGYVAKACFTKSLADGLSTAELIEKFTFKIDDVTMARSGYSIVYDETPACHALAYTLPNLYDGFPSHQHTLDVTFERDGYPTLLAGRIVLAQPVSTPYVAILTPPAADEETGEPYRIMLPDVAAPVQTQREYRVTVETATNAQQVQVVFAVGTGTISAVGGNPVATNNYRHWLFTWSFAVTNNPALIEGSFQLRANVDTDGNMGTIEAYALRDATVVLRELVSSNTNDVDDDDDGIPDEWETTHQPFPTTPASEWSNGDVHKYYLSGRTDPLSPDTDGDGLPDGLEVGWQQAATGTDTNTDTDGDGYANFRSDWDPPFYNTSDNYGDIPGVSPPSEGAKADQKAGTATDPANADTDYDGIPDGIEDYNRDGWVAGDGTNLPPTWQPYYTRDWPDGKISGGEVWTETSPILADSDEDGATDGYGEDKNFNGRIDGDANSNRVYDAGEAWTETNPLDKDTDGDGLPDGWESAYGLNPLDDGTDNLGTGTPADGSVTNGASGDPDGDTLSNVSELAGGTNPKVFNGGPPPPQGQIVIGPRTNAVVIGNVTNRGEFTDWTKADLIAVDNYDSLEEAKNGGDVYYRPWASDGLESSRDLVAFYLHDGGALASGGDGQFYFRVDMQNLQAYAEDSGLNLYVVVDAGSTGIGERKLPDSVDALTDIRWEAVVAVYDGNNGTVFVNTPGSADTVTLEDELVLSDTDVQVRTQTHADGFRSAYFNSELDAVEFSISRKALTDAGWGGNVSNLNLQVFTTRDGTQSGSGELDGPDIQDSIRTDWIAEDFAGYEDGDVDRLRYEARIALTTLSQWVGINADNDRGKAIKVISLVHGNQHVQPGSVVQNLINNGAGGGYYRTLDAHEAYGIPVTLHVTPTLAAAIQWASVDPSAGKPWLDGPAFNQRIASLIATGRVDLIGSTFSDHMLPYFTETYNSNNLLLAKHYLRSVYGSNAVSTKVLWTPERVADADVLSKISKLGFSYTFLDQMLHIRNWFGYNEAIGVNGYRINEINGIKCFAISDQYNGQKFLSLDEGPTKLLRELLNRRVRTGQWDSQHPQVMTFFTMWEQIGDRSNADAYDRLIRWLASKGWVQFVSADQVANAQADISVPPDGAGDTWNTINRGTGLSPAKTAHDWVDYSSQSDFDNWYIGSALNESLLNKHFNIRPGVPMATRYGMLYYDGAVKDAWDKIAALPDPESGLSRLGRAVLHASTFETAFHTQSTTSPNLTKFTDGSYAYPDSSYDSLVDFARYAQSQSRMAAIYDRVDEWVGEAPSVTVPQAAAADLDLDGEQEYLLYNDRLFGVFERIGGRMIGAWVRDILSGEVLQAAGNLVSFPGADTEREGDSNVQTNGRVVAYRASCLKDFWSTKPGAGSQYVNDLYTFLDRTNGWQMTSSDSEITKTVTLAAKSWKFEVQYDLNTASQPLYVRHGLSANLDDLLLNGQRTLGQPAIAGGVLTLANTNYETTVLASIGYADAGHNAGLNPAAVDDNPGAGVDFHTVPMRNLAQTHQVEMVGTNSFRFSLGFRAQPSDWDGDGMPNTYEDDEGFDAFNAADGADDDDLDGVPNADEYVSKTSPTNALDFLSAQQLVAQPTGIVVRFPTKTQREYFIWYENSSLLNPDWTLATSNGLAGTGGVYEWLDDGTVTVPAPLHHSITSRFYRISVDLPE
jgi:hypothetical protein